MRPRKSRKVGVSLYSTSTIEEVVTYYFNTPRFRELSRNTHRTYHYCLIRLCSGYVGAKKIGGVKLDRLTPQMCDTMYNDWAEDVSVSHANEMSRIFSMLINMCVGLDLLDRNPMSKVHKRTTETRSVVWTNDQVVSFLDTAFSDFKWRNIGLLVMLAYEWGQRPVDIRNLEWDNIDLEGGVTTIKQTKRGAEVELPIDEQMNEMLTEQQLHWGFQPYVVPHYRKQDRAYRPYTCGQVGILVNQVKEAAGLPDELKAGDLRKTAIVEMIKGGADSLQIMSATGHKNVASLNPYNKHNLETATAALNRRKR